MLGMQGRLYWMSVYENLAFAKSMGGVRQYKLGLFQLYQAMQIYITNTLRCTYLSSNHIKMNSGIKTHGKHTTCSILMICPKASITQNGAPQDAAKNQILYLPILVIF